MEVKCGRDCFPFARSRIGSETIPPRYKSEESVTFSRPPSISRNSDDDALEFSPSCRRCCALPVVRNCLYGLDIINIL